jgi:D-sedoheptulose 7-phosphate isomerase
VSGGEFSALGEVIEVWRETMAGYIEDVRRALEAVNAEVVESVVDRLFEAYRGDRAVYLIGNGGSAAGASHFAEDLCKGALRDSTEKRFRVLSLTDNTPFITAVANDLGYDAVFSFQLHQFARPGDVLVAISGSGNSPNILKAAAYARAHGILVVGFTGFDGGKLGGLCDLHVHVPLRDMCQTEAAHALLFHLITDALRSRIG